jgi:hypothetical protein
MFKAALQMPLIHLRFYFMLHIFRRSGASLQWPLHFLQLKCYWRNIFTSCEHGFFYLLFEQPQAIKGMPNFKFSNVQSGIANAAYLPPIFYCVFYIFCLSGVSLNYKFSNVLSGIANTAYLPPFFIVCLTYSVCQGNCLTRFPYNIY